MRHSRDDVNIRLREFLVNFIRAIDRMATIAQLPNRAARRHRQCPEARPSAGSKRSIDDAEHGASIECAMVECPKLGSANVTFHRESPMTRRNRLPCDSSTGCSGESGRANVHVGGAFLLHN